MGRFPSALECVEIERGQQDGKWGEQNHDDFLWATILGEEYGEACECALKAVFEKAEDERERWAKLLRYELVQVAAVTVAWIEAIDRRALNGGGGPEGGCRAPGDKGALSTERAVESGE